eukprot:COSAG06_NODE_1245_length_10117_cov_28.671990_9_plen_134_part_00
MEEALAAAGTSGIVGIAVDSEFGCLKGNHECQCVECVAGLLAGFDSFHMEMIKLTCNQAQDAPGLSSGVRSTLSNWGIYRSAASDPDSSAVGGRVGMEGAGNKKFAPVAAALEPGVPLEWTEAAGGGSSRSRL